MTSAPTPICFSFASLSFISSSGSLPQTRLPTVAVPLTTIGIGTTILAARPPAASTLPMSLSCFLQDGVRRVRVDADLLRPLAGAPVHAEGRGRDAGPGLGGLVASSTWARPPAACRRPSRPRSPGRPPSSPCGRGSCRTSSLRRRRPWRWPRGPRPRRRRPCPRSRPRRPRPSGTRRSSRPRRAGRSPSSRARASAACCAPRPRSPRSPSSAGRRGSSPPSAPRARPRSAGP